jgi:hypothetical protein
LRHSAASCCSADGARSERMELVSVLAGEVDELERQPGGEAGK